MSERVKIAKNIVSKEDLHAAIQQADWEELWTILLAHTIHRFIYRYGVKSKKEDLTGRAKQCISEVLSLILIEETRNWNINRYPTLKDFIISVIDSHLSNFFNKGNSTVDLQSSLTESSFCLSHEESVSHEELYKEAFRFLEEEGATDEELLIFECMADGIIKPQAIKEDLGISDSDYHNAWRRLELKLKRLRRKLSNDEK